MKPFTYYLRVRYAECDAQKVVFNSRYGEYMDAAVNEFLRALGLSGLLGCSINGELDFQLVKQTTEWRAPARFDQVLAVSVGAGHIGTTSFTLAAEFRIAGEEAVIASIETIYVLVKAHTLEKTPIPDHVRSALQKGAPGVVTDHAAHLRT